MGNTFEVDTDHKPLVPLPTGYRTTAPLRIERIRVRLQGFNYRLNEADYHSRHPELLATQKCQTCKSQAGFEVSEPAEEFDKDIMVIVKIFSA